MARNPFRTSAPTPAQIPAEAAGNQCPACTSIHHYFYFQTKDLAERAAERIRAWDCVVEIRQIANSNRWIALATERVSAQAPIYQAMVRDFMAITLEAQRGAVKSLAECRAALALQAPTTA